MIIKPVPWRPATSAALAAALSDETGTGFVVFSDSPVFTTQISTPKIVTASGNLEITPAGNAVGLGLTPGTWAGSTLHVLEIGLAGHGIADFHTGGATNDLVLCSNAIYNTGWKYAANGVANIITVGNTDGSVYFQRSAVGTAGTAITWSYDIIISSTGNVGIGITVPTAVLHLKAGTTVANTAPLQFTSGPVETTPRAGLVEYNGRFIVTESDTTNRFLVQAASSTKTTAGAPYTNDGFVTVVINGTSVKLMTTA